MLQGDHLLLLLLHLLHLLLLHHQLNPVAGSGTSCGLFFLLQVISTQKIIMSSPKEMASSQRDMFDSQDTDTETSPRLPSSLPAQLSYVYLWCILFDWDENVEHPFNMYQIAMFSKSELKPNWISGELDQNSRLKKIQFSAIKGKTFSLFAKVEKCMFLKNKCFYYIFVSFSFIFYLDTDSKRRGRILATLNELYSERIQNFNISQSYHKIVLAKPYKVLSCFVYDWTFTPLKRGEIETTMEDESPEEDADLDRVFTYPSHR